MTRIETDQNIELTHNPEKAGCSHDGYEDKVMI